MNKICFYGSSPDMYTYVQLYSSEDTPLDTIGDLHLQDTFYVFVSLEKIDRLMGYMEIILTNNTIKNFIVDFDPINDPLLEQGDTLLKFNTYIKPVDYTQEIFAYKQADGTIFFSKKDNVQNVLRYYPRSFFVLKDKDISFEFDQSACYPSKQGTFSIIECIEKESGTKPIDIKLVPVRYRFFAKLLFIFILLLLGLLLYKRKTHLKYTKLFINGNNYK
jgi:hypothetical protein